MTETIQRLNKRLAKRIRDTANMSRGITPSSIRDILIIQRELLALIKKLEDKITTLEKRRDDDDNEKF